MSNRYDDFLRRFVSYRTKMNMSQEEMGRLLGKTQSQLSKIELRKTVVSFDILESLQGIGWDVDDMVIGKEQIVLESRLTDYLAEKAGEDWKFLRELVVWILGLEFRKNGGFTDADSECEYRLLRTLLYSAAPQNVMLAVRRVIGIRQDMMAERLGVDVKKCRDLERGRIYPDAELLILIYDMCACRPTVFFQHENTEGYLIDCLWNKLGSERQEEAGTILDDVIRVYRR